MISGIDLEKDNGNNIFSILSLAGHVSEHFVCVGQVHSFGLLIKWNLDQKVEMLKSLIKSLTVLGIREPNKLDIGLEKLSETDYNMIHHLVNDPKARVEDMAKYVGVTTKTIKRRLDKLVTTNVINFSTVFKPESLHGYILYHILLTVQPGSESKIFEAIRYNHKTYFFAEPVLQTQIIILNLYARNVYELDKGYLDIINTSTKIEKSWLFIDKDIKIFQN